MKRVAAQPQHLTAIHVRSVLWLRARVWLWRWRLDRGLADGRPQEASPAHALRARQLTAPAFRRMLARSLRTASLLPSAPAAGS